MAEIKTKSKTRVGLGIALITLSVTGALAGIILVGKSGNIAKPNPAGEVNISISAPIQGETIAWNDFYQLKWNKDFKVQGQTVNNLAMELFKNGQLLKKFPDQIRNDGSQGLLMKNNIAQADIDPADNYQIKLSYKKDGQVMASGLSKEFHVKYDAAYNVELSKPEVAAETVLASDKEVEIKWTGSDRLKNFRLVLVRKDDEDEQAGFVIVDKVTGSKYTWNINATLAQNGITAIDDADRFKIRILGFDKDDRTGKRIVDVSDNWFKIKLVQPETPPVDEAMRHKTDFLLDSDCFLPIMYAGMPEDKQKTCIRAMTSRHYTDIYVYAYKGDKDGTCIKAGCPTDTFDFLTNPAKHAAFARMLKDIREAGLRPVVFLIDDSGLDNDIPPGELKSKIIAALPSFIEAVDRYASSYCLGIEVNETWTKEQADAVGNKLSSLTQKPIAVHMGVLMYDYCKSNWCDYMIFQTNWTPYHDPISNPGDIKRVIQALNKPVVAGEYCGICGPHDLEQGRSCDETYCKKLGDRWMKGEGECYKTPGPGCLGGWCTACTDPVTDPRYWPVGFGNGGTAR